MLPGSFFWHPLACEKVVPFYRPGELEGDAWAEHATATYRSAFDAAQRHGLVSVAVPLLGAHFAASRSRGPNTRFPIFEGAACTCPSPYRLGAGARGAEMPDASFALKAAAEAAVSMRAATIASFPAQLWTRIGAVVSWQGLVAGGCRLTARFGVQTSTLARALAEAIEEAMHRAERRSEMGHGFEAARRSKREPSFVEDRAAVG